MRLAYVYDGDTLGCLPMAPGATEAVRIRLAWIDAPELHQGTWGLHARAYLRGLLLTNEAVTVRQAGTDPYGRPLAEVLRTRDDGNCSLRLVLGGYAALWHCPASQPAYHAAQAIARARRRGIWSRPGLHQTPWLFR
jgi:endonuclease YncB( thermonuclease family)